MMRFWRLVQFGAAIALAGGPAAATVTPIATIQANPAMFESTVVTVHGHVYIPTNYRAPTISGYIQDDSGRGINLFGASANTPLLQDVGNIVQVTGRVSLFFTTVEIVDLTEITLLGSGNVPRTPQHLTTGQANGSQWEGTFIEVTGTVQSVIQGFGREYNVDDGSGAIRVRVVPTLGAPEFTPGQIISARGAGSKFASTYLLLVGRSTDVFEGPVGVDASSWGRAKLELGKPSR